MRTVSPTNPLAALSAAPKPSPGRFEPAPRPQRLKPSRPTTAEPPAAKPERTDDAFAFHGEEAPTRPFSDGLEPHLLAKLRQERVPKVNTPEPPSLERQRAEFVPAHPLPRRSSPCLDSMPSLPIVVTTDEPEAETPASRDEEPALEAMEPRVAFDTEPPARIRPSALGRPRRWTRRVFRASMCSLIVAGGVLITWDTAKNWLSSTLAALPSTSAEPIRRAILAKTVVSKPAPRSDKAAAPRQPPPKSQASQASIPWLAVGESTESVCQPDTAGGDAPNKQALRDARAAHAAGLRALVRGSVRDSLGKLCEAAALNPKEPGLALDIARTSLLARNAKAAERWVEQALALDPMHKQARELHADSLAWQGHVDAARDAWFAIHDITRPDAKVVRELYRGAMLEGTTALRRGELAKAERLFRRAVVLDETSSEALTRVAEVVFRQGHAPSAERWLSRALALQPDDSRRQLLAGDIDQALGDPEAATLHWQRALELDPKNSAARQRLAAN